MLNTEVHPLGFQPGEFYREYFVTWARKNRGNPTFIPRNPDLQNPGCCRTIADVDVIEAVEKYQRERPEDARKLRLPERPSRP